MDKIKKEDVMDIMNRIRCRGITQARVAKALGRNKMTVWAWGSGNRLKRVPCKSEYEALIKIMEEGL